MPFLFTRFSPHSCSSEEILIFFPDPLPSSYLDSRPCHYKMPPPHHSLTHRHAPLISEGDSIDKLLIAAACAGLCSEVPSNGIWRF